MKILSLMAILLFAFVTVSANPDFKVIGNLIQSGNTQALAAHLDSRIELALPGFDDMLSSNQAVSQMNNFFEKNKPSHFEVVHIGTSQSNGAHYCIGNLRTTNGTFRVYIYTRKVGNADKIQEIRIEQD